MCGARRVVPGSSGSVQKSNIKVVVRLRPFLAHEGPQDDPVAWVQYDGAEEIAASVETDEEWAKKVAGRKGVVMMKNGAQRGAAEYSYGFDACYDNTSQQKDLYTNEVQPALKHIFDGYNTTVFAYGITGSGKTFTMEGAKKNRGVIPRAVDYIFNHIKRHDNRHRKENPEYKSPFKVSMSYMEIYKEKVYDLLVRNSHDRDLPVREGYDKEIVISGLSQIEIASAADFQQRYDDGCKNRTTGATKLNATSSRSHAIVQLRVQQRDAKNPDRYTSAKLYLIDLAGAEDNRRTENRGERMNESTNINLSLLALSKVVNALIDGDQRVPYRDSKLTRILQDSLGGRSRAVMIACICPVEDLWYHTYCSLNFASKSRQVVNSATQSVYEDVQPLPVASYATSRSARGPAAPISMKERLEQYRKEKEAREGPQAPLQQTKKRRLSEETHRSSTGSITATASTTAGGISNSTASSKLRRTSSSSTSSSSEAAVTREVEQRIETKLEQKYAERLAQLEKQQQTLLSPSLRSQNKLSSDMQERLEKLERMLKEKAMEERVPKRQQQHAKLGAYLEDDDDEMDDVDALIDLKDPVVQMTPSTKLAKVRQYIDKANEAQRSEGLCGALVWLERALSVLPESIKLKERVESVKRQIAEGSDLTTPGKAPRKPAQRGLSFAVSQQSAFSSAKENGAPRSSAVATSSTAFSKPSVATTAPKTSAVRPVLAERKSNNIVRTAQAKKPQTVQKRDAERPQQFVAKVNGDLKQQLEQQLIATLNAGSVSDLLKLKSIGLKRAEKIIDGRQNGIRYTALTDLGKIGLSQKQITTFRNSNLVEALVLGDS